MRRANDRTVHGTDPDSGSRARLRPFIRNPLATPSEIASEDPPFPVTDEARPNESGFADWRERLTRNLSRRSDGRWDPLGYVHGAPRTPADGESE